MFIHSLLFQYMRMYVYGSENTGRLKGAGAVDIGHDAEVKAVAMRWEAVALALLGQALQAGVKSRP
jgi:hypothetical protein